MSPPTNPLSAVREGARWVSGLARYVSIDERAVERLAERIAVDAPSLEWDAALHYREGMARTTQYLLVLDALNFCFWPEPAWEYDRLALALKESMEQAPKRFDAAALAASTAESVTTLLGGRNDIPLLPQRVALLRELGAVLAARWDGEAANLVAAAGGSAATLVALITAEFPGFRDHAIYQGMPVYLYKRAQIFVGDVWGANGGEGLGHFHDIDQLTMFADYRVPQLLRAEEVLRYNARLASIVDLCRELPSGSDLEIEIRATTIHAVELLRAAIERHGVTMSSIQLDWLLWEVGEARRQELDPHHRTLTIYY